MVKSVLGVNHQGLRDWVIQRITAIIIALYTLGMAYYFIAHPEFNFVEWRMLFSFTWMKIATLLLFLSLFFHAWVGIWTVITDYVKPAILRFILEMLVLLTLLVCFIWAFQIVWGI